MNDDDQQLEETLAAALTPGPDRTPPPDRIAALRAQVEARARATSDGATDPATVVEMAPLPRRSRRRDVLVGGIAASIGAALGVGGALVVGEDEGDEGPPTEPITFAGAPAGVSTDAALINHTWGTELLLDIEGLPADRDYQVIFAGTDGRPALAGSFRSVADTLMVCRFNSAVLRADTNAVLIVGPDGDEVLRADLS